MKERAGERIKLTSYNDLLGVGDDQFSVEIDISRIKAFKSHPFKVVDDEKMEELVESIKQNGILTPVLVRPIGDTEYEMLSGHRRMYAAGRCGLRTIPAIIKEMSDDEAVVVMVDANIQREELLPSERAFAYKMRMDAIKRQGQRSDLTFGHQVQKWAHEEIGKDVGLSGRQINRYICLTKLIPEMLDNVDEKKVPLSVGVEISYIDEKIQKWLCKYIVDNNTVTATQISALREKLEYRDITYAQMVEILKTESMPKSSPKKLTIKAKDLQRFFPEDYSFEKMEETIMQLLQKWSDEQKGGE